MSQDYSIKLRRRLWDCLWTKNSMFTRIQLITAIIAIFCTICIKLIVPYFLKQIVLQISTTSKTPQISLIWLIILYIMTWCIAQNMESIRNIIIRFPVAKATFNFYADLVAHIQRLSIRYHMDRKTGSILSAYKEIHWAYPELVETALNSIVPLVFEAVFTIAILSYFYSLSFAMALLTMFVLYNLLTYFTSNSIVIYRAIQNKCDSDVNTFVVDSLLNAETVKLFSTQNYEYSQGLKRLLAKENADVNMLNADAKIHLIQNLIIGATLTFMTVIAGIQAWHDTINVSDFIFIYGYIFIFMQPLSNLGYLIRKMRGSVIRLNMAIDILNKPIEIQDIQNARPLQVNKGDIQFKNVEFSYNPDRKIIHNISFDIPSGKTVAIVGPTGSGKSTIARLLFRLYNLNSGSIFIDGQNIAEATLGSLRESIGIVPQDCILFNMDIRDNIQYGKICSSEDELIAAIKESELDNIISKLPNKLNTIVGERGLRLSGGEKQRVAIARMLIKKPKIMVFDEATSSLDVHAERQIQNNICRISRDITTLIIAHRLSTITYADLILVMDHGEIKERGTHAELLAKNELYATLWKRQFEGGDGR